MKMLTPKPNAAEIKVYRDVHQCSLQQARDHLLDEWKKSQLYHIQSMAIEIHTVSDCQNVIVDLLDLMIDAGEN
jgi:hypothetical protein